MALQPTTCPLDCPDSCGVLVETDGSGGLVRLRGNPDHPHSRGVLCQKTSTYADLVTSPDRLRSPLVRAGGSFRAASWTEALGRVAERVAALAGEDLLALSYSGCMGLVNRRFPLRAMHALGATLHDSGICDRTATAGYEAVLGAAVGPHLDQLSSADAVLLWGIDVARTFQHLQPAIQRLCKRGVPAVAIDVYRTDTIRALERWGGRGLVVRPGSDAAVALAVARVAYENGWHDAVSLERDCVGASEFEAHVRGGPGPAEAGRIAGIEPEEVERLAATLHGARAPFVKTGVGFARRRNGGASMRAVCSMAAVLGHADRVHFESAAHFGLPLEVVDRPDLRRGDCPVTSHIGLGRDLCDGRFGAVLVWGHNPAVTLPDSGRVRAGLARDDLFLVVHEQFMTETAALADVVLPATTFVEQSDVYQSYGHRVLQYGRRAVAPPEGPRSNVRTFAALARALELPAATWDVSEDGLCRELLEASRERIGSRDWERVLAGEPVELRPLERAGRGTPSGRVELVSAACAGLGQPAMATYVPDEFERAHGAFWLIAAPSVATHNSTFSHSPRHLRRQGAPVCHLNPRDAAQLGLAAGDRAVLSNPRGSLTFGLALSDDMPRGTVRVDGLPRAADLPEGVGLNLLTGPEPSDLGNGNAYYSTRVDVAPA